jgi:predicted ABC-type exoprotein transport system permease subunit
MPGVLAKGLAGILVGLVLIIMVFAPAQFIEWLKRLKPRSRTQWIFVAIVFVTLVALVLIGIAVD